MKLTPEQKARLKALILKAKADRTDEEAVELRGLKALALDEKYKYDEATGDEIVEEPMGASEVKSIVIDALAGLGLDADMVKQIKEGLDAKGEVTAESIKLAITEAVGGKIDAKELSTLIEAKMPKDLLTSESVKTMFADLRKEMQEDTRKASKMVFPIDAAMPIESRGGNLSVAGKQLLNLCLQGVSDSALADSDGGRGIERPKSMNDGITEVQLAEAAHSGVAQITSMRKAARLGQKVLTAGGANTGAEFVPTDLSSELQSRLYLNSELAAALIMNEVQMPTNPFQFPLVTTRPTFYKGSENPGADPSDSTSGTDNITLTAAKLIGICKYSYEADEDSIIAILPFLQEQMGLSASEALEEALVNGDTSTVHMDSDVQALGATDRRRLFKGLRKLALAGSVTSSFATGGVAASNIAALRKMMKIWGVKPSELLLICGPNGYNDIIQLDETLTMDKVGNSARIVTGIAPQIYGIPVLVSSAVRENLNASGVYDDSTVTKGSMLLMHKPSFMVGVRRGFTVETDVDKAQQLNSVIASFRRDFQPKETPSTSLPLVAMGYNYDA